MNELAHILAVVSGFGSVARRNVGGHFVFIFHSVLMAIGHEIVIFIFLKRCFMLGMHAWKGGAVG